MFLCLYLVFILLKFHLCFFQKILFPNRGFHLLFSFIYINCVIIFSCIMWNVYIFFLHYLLLLESFAYFIFSCHSVFYSKVEIFPCYFVLVHVVCTCIVIGLCEFGFIVYTYKDISREKMSILLFWICDPESFYYLLCCL